MRLTKRDEGYWLRRNERQLGFNCRWDPDLDLNGVRPIRDPDNLSPKELQRTRRLLNMLLAASGPEGLIDARKIIAAYPQLYVEYDPKISKRARELRRHPLYRLRATKRALFPVGFSPKRPPKPPIDPQQNIGKTSRLGEL